MINHREITCQSWALWNTNFHNFGIVHCVPLNFQSRIIEWKGTSWLQKKPIVPHWSFIRWFGMNQSHPNTPRHLSNTSRHPQIYQCWHCEGHCQEFPIAQTQLGKAVVGYNLFSYCYSMPFTWPTLIDLIVSEGCLGDSGYCLEGHHAKSIDETPVKEHWVLFYLAGSYFLNDPALSN